MNDIVEKEKVTLFDTIKCFRSLAEGISSGAAPGYRKAVASLSSFLTLRDKLSGTLSEGLLADWLAFLYISGISFKTASMYLNSVSGLYKKGVADGFFEPTDAFKNIKVKLKAAGDLSSAGSLTGQDFTRMVNLCKSASGQSGDTAKAVDLILFSLLNGCRPIMEVAMLTRQENVDISEESKAIIDRHSSPHRKYVFDLRQSCRTPRQLAHAVSVMVMELFKERNLPFFGSVDETLRSYWAFAALKYGLTADTVLSFIGGVPRGVAVLSLADHVDMAGNRRYAVARAAGEMFVANPLRWYAMRLRPRVSYDELESRFEQIRDELHRPDTFYPCEEIARRIGKKLIFEKKPVISDIVFFRARVTDILAMFARIGDLAWCYTAPGSNGRTYAAISDTAFRQFQETIGQFTPEYQVAPVGKLEPRENERVVVIGGLFQGREADFKRIDPDTAENTIYRLQLLGDNGFEWRIGVDRRLLRKKA